MFQSILSNLAIILFGHLLMTSLISYRKHIPRRLLQILIVLLYSGTIVTMFYLPIQFGEYRLDLRLIPLIFLALFRGWKVTIPTLMIVSVWRLIMGEAGAVPGVVFGMVLPTLFCLVLYNAKNYKMNPLFQIMIITVCWFISDFPIIFIVPNGLEVFSDIVFVRYISFIIVAIVYYAFIIIAYKNESLKIQLEFLANHDSLTGLLSRRSFYKIVNEKVKNKQYVHSLAMIDIDHFKRLNDTYGHLAGDKVLVEISAIFKKYESENIKIARYGGEEFIIHQITNTRNEAIQTLKNIQNEIRSTSFQIDDHISTSVLVSIGFATFEHDYPMEVVLNQADNHLYIAKRNGRDQMITDSTCPVKTKLT